MAKIEVAPVEATKVSEGSDHEAAQKLDDATYEPKAYIEQKGDYKQSEAIQTSLTALVHNAINNKAGAVTSAPEVNPVHSEQTITKKPISTSESTTKMVNTRDEQINPGILSKNGIVPSNLKSDQGLGNAPKEDGGGSGGYGHSSVQMQLTHDPWLWASSAAQSGAQIGAKCETISNSKTGNQTVTCTDNQGNTSVDIFIYKDEDDEQGVIGVDVPYSITDVTNDADGNPVSGTLNIPGGDPIPVNIDADGNPVDADGTPWIIPDDSDDFTVHLSEQGSNDQGENNQADNSNDEIAGNDEQAVPGNAESSGDAADNASSDDDTSAASDDNPASSESSASDTQSNPPVAITGVAAASDQDFDEEGNPKDKSGSSGYIETPAGDEDWERNVEDEDDEEGLESMPKSENGKEYEFDPLYANQDNSEGSGLLGDNNDDGNTNSSSSSSSNDSSSSSSYNSSSDNSSSNDSSSNEGNNNESGTESGDDDGGEDDGEEIEGGGGDDSGHGHLILKDGGPSGSGEEKDDTGHLMGVAGSYGTGRGSSGSDGGDDSGHQEVILKGGASKILSDNQPGVIDPINPAGNITSNKNENLSADKLKKQTGEH